MNQPKTASSAYFALPKFGRGDLEEIMKDMRPHEVREIASEVPFFPFPDDAKTDDAGSCSFPGLE
jgi:hypothetical protein